MYIVRSCTIYTIQFTMAAIYSRHWSTKFAVINLQLPFFNSSGMSY